MACSGCAARRAWIKKMARLAYERAFRKRPHSSADKPDGSNESPL